MAAFAQQSAETKPNTRVADVQPLMDLMGSTMGLIPVIGTPHGDVLLLGSVQFVPLPPGVGDFYVLRWRFVDKEQELGILARRLGTATETESDDAASVSSSRAAMESKELAEEKPSSKAATAGVGIPASSMQLPSSQPYSSSQTTSLDRQALAEGLGNSAMHATRASEASQNL